ncbi:hypothetical protein T484DRAFT_1834131 [Baffinella frigidus]|nr:hypothetical protein T484DRAFT_1834131 [Cryptophyta sp. CCMP2293]
MPHLFPALIRILKRVDNSVLWIMEYPEGGKEAMGNLRNEATRLGLKGAATRIVATPLISRHRHLLVKAHAHLLLDTTPYNGPPLPLD